MPTDSTRLRHPLAARWRWLGLTGVLFAGGIAIYLLMDGGEAPPPVAARYEGNAPAANVARGQAAPEDRFSGYVEDAQCAECHERIHDSYMGHPMGRSMGPIDEILARGMPLPEDRAAFSTGDYRYHVVQEGERLLHVEERLDEAGASVSQVSVPVAYAVGSGERGQSFLVNRDGRLFLSPITWYPQRDRWDLSPGYETTNSHFNRPVIVQCLFCHANRSLLLEGTRNTYRAPIFAGHAIGCQRCHGPGADHIALQDGSADDADLQETIVNPAKLEPHLRDAVCEQCHLSGAAKVVRRGKSLYDFRPGMPLEDVLRVFVDAPSEETPDQDEQARFVGHVEQMAISRCYQESGGQMGCTSCHDPHMRPAADDRVGYFRSRCLDCHEERGCSEAIEVRQATAGDSCMACHMPARPTEIRHAAITDHRILRHPDEPSGAPPAARADGGIAGLVPFHLRSAEEPEVRRDAALALLRLDHPNSRTLEGDLLRRIALDLKAAVERFPDDVPAWEGYALTAWRMGDPTTALKCLETALQQSPGREFAVINAATIAAQLGRHDQALAYWRQAVTINPWMVLYRAELAQALVTVGRWREGETLCRQTLEHFPDSHRSRQLLIESLLGQGNRERADAEFAAWLRFRPAPPHQLRAWYENHPLRRRN